MELNDFYNISFALVYEYNNRKIECFELRTKFIFFILFLKNFNFFDNIAIIWKVNYATKKGFIEYYEQFIYFS